MKTKAGAAATILLAAACAPILLALALVFELATRAGACLIWALRRR